MSCVFILSMLTLYPLLLGWSYFRRLALSLNFSVVSRELILDYSWVFPIFAIYRALSSRYVALNIMPFFLHSRYSLMVFDFWWRRLVMLRGSHHLLPVMSDSFVTVFSFIFLYLSILCMRRLIRRRRSWESLTVLEDFTLLMWRRRTL